MRAQARLFWLHGSAPCDALARARQPAQSVAGARPSRGLARRAQACPPRQFRPIKREPSGALLRRHLPIGTVEAARWRLPRWLSVRGQWALPPASVPCPGCGVSVCAGAISPKDAPAQSPGCAGSHGRGTLGGCARACSACARASAQPATSAQCFLVCSTVHLSFLTPVDIGPDHQGERMGLASCARALCARHARGAAHGSSRRSHPRMVAGGSGGGGGGSGGGRQRAAKVSG